MSKPKEPLKLTTDHLKNNPKRKFGPERDGKVECKRHHCFYVAWEGCPDCPSWEELCDSAVDKLRADTQPCSKPVDEYDDDTMPMTTGYWP